MNKSITSLIILFLIQSCGAYAEDHCKAALDACIDLNTEQANYISQLKTEVKQLEFKEQEKPNAVLWVLAGVVVGGFGTLLLKR